MRPSRLLPVCALVLGACAEPTDPPGLVGTFDVHMALGSNTCGYGALPLPSQSDLTAELRGYAGEAATWTFSGKPAVDGYASSTGAYHFESRSQSMQYAADPTTGAPGCTLETHTELVLQATPAPHAPPDGGVADAGTGGTTLTGTYTIDVYPTTSSNCAALLGTYGGTYGALPCRGAMTVTGSLAN